MESRVLEGQVAIVTGAGTGIGRAIAQEFAANGARIALLGRRESKLDETARSIPGPDRMIIVCDVSDRNAVQDAVARVVSAWGGVDILVNNASINSNPRSVFGVDPSVWDRTIQINLTGSYNCLRAVLDQMRSRKNGLVINISSIAGKRASKLAGAAYSATKHGVAALTHSINEEEVEFNIRATTIFPGEVETPLLDDRPNPPSEEKRRTMLQPEDLAHAALFVAALPPRACVPELIIKPTVQLYQ